MRRLLKRLWGTSRRRHILLVAAPFALVALSVLSVELTSTNTFCGTCHIMQSYHESWSTSAHAEFDCVECHIEPGVENLAMAKLNGLGQAIDDILNRTSTQPSASVSDLSCQRDGCHSVEEIEGLEQKKDPYLFTHAKHTGLAHNGIEVHCTTCHSHITGSEHFQVNTNVCIACHLLEPQPREGGPFVTALLEAPAGVAPAAITREGIAGEAGEKIPPTGCRDCHEPPAEPIDYRGLKVVHAEYLAYGAACESCHRGVTARSEPVTDDRCMGCHDFGRERITTVEQLHEEHSIGKHKVECFSCHGTIAHGPSAQTMRLDQIDCRACHGGQHLLQQETYRAQGETPADPHAAVSMEAVTPMFLAHVDCTGCHVRPRPLEGRSASGERVAVATAEACDACHKPGLGDQMIPLWQEKTKQLYASVEKLLPPADRPVEDTRAERLVAEARQLLEIVRLDGSWGVHNPPYTERLLEQARLKANQAAALYARAD